MNIRHYTWAASPDDPRMRLFLLSARKSGLTPAVIKCASTIDKPRALAAEIAAVPDDTLLICTDAFDVLCLAPPEEIARRFASFGREIVFGAELGGYHHLASSRKFFETRSGTGPYRYLNSGVIAGNAGAVKRMLAALASWDTTVIEKEFRTTAAKGEHFNDQTLFGRYAALNPETTGLDREARLCWNAHGEFDKLEKTLESSNGEIANPSTGVQPCFLHITQIAKYYPLYLTAAFVLGLPLNGGTVDIDLFDRHMTNTVQNIDEHVVEVDPRVARVMARSLAYRRLKAGQAMIAWYKKIRMDIGKRRRTLLRTGDR